MRIVKKIVIGFLVVLTFVIGSSFDLFSRYNVLTAHIDLMRGTLIYPQCEFEGDDLDDINPFSQKEMGFEVVYTDCDLFYTRGMDDYYIMFERIEERNGKN